MTSFTALFSISLVIFQWHRAFAVTSQGLPKSVTVVRRNGQSKNDQTLIAIRGDAVTLQCEFSVSGWSFIRWVKFMHSDEVGGNIVTKSVPSEELKNETFAITSTKLGNIGDEDVGNYSCILTSLTGSQTFKFAIAVKDNRSCVEETCFPNGQCVERLTEYMCECNAGFVGHHCQFTDPCLNSPCQNNGTCVANGQEFDCVCSSGFKGPLCETEICTNETCGEGTCKQVDGSVKCICTHSTAGDRCQYKCKFNEMYCNSLTCIITPRLNGKYQESCRCDNNRRSHGISGNRCMMESDVRNECDDPNICNRGGSCYDYIYQYRCDCHSYHSGKNCEIYNECQWQGNLCNINGGTCVDLPHGYKCKDCPAGQHGDKCHHRKNPCKVTCYGHKMTAECDMRFVPIKLRSLSISLNSRTCQFRRNEETYYGYRHSRNFMRRRMDIRYNECGTEVQFDENYITFRNNLRVGSNREISEDMDSAITKTTGYFLFKMECKIPVQQNGSNSLSALILEKNETEDSEDVKEFEFGGTQITFFKENYRSSTNQYVVGDQIFVKMTINIYNNPILYRGYELHPVTCVATPNPTEEAMESEEKYVILLDGCILDKSFEVLNRGDERESYFKFDSFYFKSNPGKMYLQCTSRFCPRRSGSTCKPKCNPTTTHFEVAERNTITTAAPTTAYIARNSVDVQASQRDLEH